MEDSKISNLCRLAEKEGWDIALNDKGVKTIFVDSVEYSLRHPYLVHLQLYRELKDPIKRMQSMRRINTLLWPDHEKTWNHWTERRFLAHCSDNKEIVMAGGASTGKSHDAAKIALIFYLSHPKGNACVVASTTLESLENRIWGYVVKLAQHTAIPTTCRILRSKPPKIIYPGQIDKIHGMFAVAIREGENNRVLSTLIGRHPDHGILVILDEATDMNPAILSSLPNLEQGVEVFQAIAIGNSSSKHDLHGAMATPKAGWDSVDPMKDYVWTTNRDKGICLYFNPYDSPAIIEEDPVKRLVLGKFLITLEGVKQKVMQYGEDSAAFWRFVLGFWQKQAVDSVVLSEAFINEHHVFDYAEWSGLEALQVVAGLDPAFQSGGVGCILRFAMLGQTVSGKMCLDFRREELLFRIDIKNAVSDSSELQLAKQVVALLREHKCPLVNLALDATGVGRALGELIRIVSGEPGQPIRIVSAKHGANKDKDFEAQVLVKSNSDLWMEFRNFVQSDCVKGLDYKSILQFTSRLINLKNNKLVLETKKEYRDRMAAINPAVSHSPDESDAATLCLQAAKIRFGFFPGQKKEIQVVDGNRFWSEKMFMVQKERQAILEAASHQGHGPARPRIGHAATGHLGNLLNFARKKTAS